MNSSTANADPAELAKFGALARNWWDPKGPSRPLHELNPLRLEYILRVIESGTAAGAGAATAAAARAAPLAAALAGRRILDVGCGGGILSEAMAKNGAEVLGIDLAPAVLEVAELHALEAHIDVKYRAVAAEDLAVESPGAFDVVTCMEMLEHVPQPTRTLAALATLVKPGGDVIVSTLNRSALAFAVAIIGAEYVARVLPRGTHQYLKFIKPSELARWGRGAGLEIKDLTGITYNPLTRAFRLSNDTGVNYLAHFRRSGSLTAAGDPP